MHFRVKGFENCSFRANWFIKVCFFIVFTDQRMIHLGTGKVTAS